MKLSVVYSFYNESGLLDELLDRTLIICSRLIEAGLVDDFELLFINDCSQDESSQVIEKWIDRYPGKIVLINMARNFGVSECVLAGFEYSSGDLVVYLDADLQDPPEVIFELVKTQALENCDVVYTVRTRRRGESRLKLAVTWFGYRLLNAISPNNLPVDAGDFKLLSRRVVNNILSLRESRPYLRGLVSWVGFRQVPVYYERHERGDGRDNTKMNVLSSKVLNYWLDRALINHSDLPLKSALAIGFVIVMLAIVLTIYILIAKISGHTLPGWAGIAILIVFFSGVQISIIGVMGLYVSSIFNQVKERPRFIIESIVR